MYAEDLKDHYRQVQMRLRGGIPQRPQVVRSLVRPEPPAPPKVEPEPPPPPKFDKEAFLQKIRNGELFASPKNALVLAEGMDNYYGMEKGSILSRARTQPLVWHRQEFYYHLRETFGWSLLKIHDVVQRDHTTVLWGILQYEKRQNAGSVGGA